MIKRKRLKKKQRLHLFIFGSISIIFSLSLVLYAIDDGLYFFRSPTDVANNVVQEEEIFRLGGLVKEHSVKAVPNSAISQFSITDGEHDVVVQFDGILPSLFREGQGTVALGYMTKNNTLFIAEEVLAKHDENYVPAEVVDALKKSGHWKGTETQ